MTKRTMLSVGLALGLAAGPAAATAPGDEQTFYLDQYRSVCVDDPSVQCTDLDPNGALSGLECAVPAVPPCRPDFVSPPLRLRGTMTIIVDDDTQDDAPTQPGADDDNLAYTVLIEVHAGDDSFTYANTFYAADQPAFCATATPCAVISQWSPVDDEGDGLFIADTGGFVPPAGSVFGDLRTQLEALAQTKFGVTAVPLLTGFAQKPELLDDARNNTRATVSRWRVQIDYVNP